MNSFTNFLASLIVAVLLVVLSVFSIQNVELVSLKFFIFNSAKLPVGVLSAFSLALGIILGAFLPVLLRSTPRKNKSFKPKPSYLQRDFVEDDPLENW